MLLSMRYEKAGHVLTSVDDDGNPLREWWAHKRTTLRNERTAIIESLDTPVGGKRGRGGGVFECLFLSPYLHIGLSLADNETLTEIFF